MRRLTTLLAALVLGLAGLTVSTPAQAATELLPDLRMLAPTDFRIENTGTEKRLRFTTVVVNAGAGPFHVLATRPDTSTARMSLRQSISRSDGRVRRVDIPISKSYAFWAGDGHNHWHIYKLQQFQIAKVDNGVVGPIRGYGSKIGFCFYDNTKYDLSLPNAPQTPRYTGCGVRTATQVTMGLSVGWGDTYGADLAYQYIKINSLSDGTYRVRINADPGRVFEESNEGNNVAFGYIRITGNTVTAL